MKRRQFLAASLACAAGTAFSAESRYPDRPITLIVGAPAGSVPDVLTRVVAKNMERLVHNPLIVLNKVGARGIIAGEMASKAAPDGYTLITGYAAQFCIEPALNPNLSFDPLHDFSPVAMLASLSPLLTVKGDSKINDLQALIDIAKKEPGSLTIGATSSTSILLVEMLQRAAGIKLLRIPYKSSGDARMDLISGRIDANVDAPVLSLLHSGQMKALANFDVERSEVLPDIPSFAELGFGSLSFVGWNGILAPAGVPAAISAYLLKCFDEAADSAEVRQILKETGSRRSKMGADDFARLIKDDIDRYTETAEKLGLRGNLVGR